jgi:hypothetical protein
MNCNECRPWTWAGIVLAWGVLAVTSTVASLAAI